MAVALCANTPTIYGTFYYSIKCHCTRSLPINGSPPSIICVWFCSLRLQTRTLVFALFILGYVHKNKTTKIVTNLFCADYSQTNIVRIYVRTTKKNNITLPQTFWNKSSRQRSSRLSRINYLHPTYTYYLWKRLKSECVCIFKLAAPWYSVQLVGNRNDTHFRPQKLYVTPHSKCVKTPTPLTDETIIIVDRYNRNDQRRRDRRLLTNHIIMIVVHVHDVELRA